MRKILILILFICIFSDVPGQKLVTNKLTSSHQNISGTKISIIAPEGFIKAANFFGLQQDQSGSTIMVMDLPGPFSEISKGLTKEGFLSQGVEVSKMETLLINGLSAILATGKQNANGIEYTKYVLVFGTDKETIMINAAFPKNLKEIGKEIKKSILTVIYEAEKVIDPFANVDFTIQISGSNLKFARSVSGSFIYTTDGLIPSQSDDKSTFLVSKSFTKIKIEDTKLFCLNRIRKMPFEIQEIETTSEISIDGISGYEIVAWVKDNKSGEREKVYQVILFSDSLYYIMLGTTNREFDTNIDQFREIASTFSRK